MENKEKRRIHYDKLNYEWEGSYSYNDEPYTGTAFTTDPEDNPEGRVVEEMEYIDGWKTNYKSFYQSGRVAEEVILESDGAFARKWHLNEQLAKEETSEGGVVSRRKQWDENGKLTEDFLISEQHPQYKRVLQIRQLKEENSK